MIQTAYSPKNLALATPPPKRNFPQAILLLVILQIFSSYSHAGDLLWETKIGGEIRFKIVHDTGILLVGDKSQLFGIDPESGAVKWKIEKLVKNYDPESIRPIPGSPLMILEKKEGMTKPMSLQCFNVTTGEKVWEISRNKYGQMNDVPKEWAERVTGKKVKNDTEALLIPEGWPTSVRGIYPDFERNQFVISLLKPSIYVNYKRTPFEGGAMAVDMDSGKVNWVYVLPKKTKVAYTDSELSVEDDTAVLDWAGVHSFNLVDGTEVAAATFERQGPKGGVAPTVIEDGTAYVVAKDTVVAVDINSGVIQWRSAKYKGAIPELQISGDKLVAQLGGNFEKKPGELKEYKPYGVMVLDRATGKELTDFKKLNNKIRYITPIHIEDNAAYFATNNSFRALDLDTLDYRFSVDLGKLRKEDTPKTVFPQDDKICLAMTQTTKGFNPQTGADLFSQTFESPGVSNFAKIAMVAVTAMGATVAQSRANQTGRSQKYTNLLPMLSKRYTAAEASGIYNYVLWKGDKKPTIVGVSLKTGKADRKAVIDSKSPDYIVDELGGVLYNIQKKKTIQAFDLKN